MLGDGSKHPEEVANKSQTFITTAGWKGTFPYERLIDMLVASVIDPKHYMILGGTFETPVKEGLLDEDFVDKLKLEGEPSVSALKTFTSYHWGIIIF